MSNETDDNNQEHLVRIEGGYLDITMGVDQAYINLPIEHAPLSVRETAIDFPNCGVVLVANEEGDLILVKLQNVKDLRVQKLPPEA
jgi:hypothetical protein